MLARISGARRFEFHEERLARVRCETQGADYDTGPPSISASNIV